MILDLFDRLLDRVIQLMRETGKGRRASFNDTVVPLYEDMQKIHEAYMLTFRRYRDMLNDVGTPVPVVLQTIAADRLFNHTARSRALYSAIAARDDIDDDGFREFAEGIVAYVSQSRDGDEAPLQLAYGGQRWGAYYMRLVTLNESEFSDRKNFIRHANPLAMIRGIGISRFTERMSNETEAIRLLDLVVWIMQREFDGISIAYEKLRSRWSRLAPLP